MVSPAPPHVPGALHRAVRVERGDVDAGRRRPVAHGRPVRRPAARRARADGDGAADLPARPARRGARRHPRPPPRPHRQPDGDARRLGRRSPPSRRRTRSRPGCCSASCSSSAPARRSPRRPGRRSCPSSSGAREIAQAAALNGVSFNVGRARSAPRSAACSSRRSARRRRSRSTRCRSWARSPCSGSGGARAPARRRGRAHPQRDRARRAVRALARRACGSCWCAPALFMAFASALWALLPIVARDVLELGSGGLRPAARRASASARSPARSSCRGCAPRLSPNTLVACAGDRVRRGVARRRARARRRRSWWRRSSSPGSPGSPCSRR